MNLFGRRQRRCCYQYFRLNDATAAAAASGPLFCDNKYKITFPPGIYKLILNPLCKCRGWAGHFVNAIHLLIINILYYCDEHITRRLKYYTYVVSYACDLSKNK